MVWFPNLAVENQSDYLVEFMLSIHSRLHQARSLSGYAGDPLLQIGHEVRNESRVLCFDEFQVTASTCKIIFFFGAILTSYTGHR
jgi:peroxisome-assembly ATPase